MATNINLAGALLHHLNEGTSYANVTAEMAVDAIIKKYEEDPLLLKQLFTFKGMGDTTQFYEKLEPAIKSRDAWFREDTIRDEKGTDAETRVFVNEIWADYYRTLRVRVRSEYGQFTDINFEVIW